MVTASPTPSIRIHISQLVKLIENDHLKFSRNRTQKFFDSVSKLSELLVFHIFHCFYRSFMFFYFFYFCVCFVHYAILEATHRFVLNEMFFCVLVHFSIASHQYLRKFHKLFRKMTTNSFSNRISNMQCIERN